MTRRFLLLLSVASAALAAFASPSMAVVGGNDASPGEYPAVAQITFGAFLCTGTLISPDTVLSAGHCGSVTGAAVASPASWPAPLINVRIGGTRDGEGERVPVQSVTVNPDYLLTSGYDISLLKLTRNAAETPVKVAGSGERGTWSAGTMETIVGWGATARRSSQYLRRRGAFRQAAVLGISSA